MHSAYDGMNRPVAGQLANVFQRVHHARMGAAQEDHNPVGGIKEERLVIDEWTGPGTGDQAREGSGRCLQREDTEPPARRWGGGVAGVPNGALGLEARDGGGFNPGGLIGVTSWGIGAP